MMTQTHTAKILDNLTSKWVSLAELRKAAGLTRADFDAAIMDLYDAGAIRVEAQPFRWRITPEDVAAAIRIGGEDRHLVGRTR